MSPSFTEFLLSFIGPYTSMLTAGFIAIVVVLIVLPKVVTPRSDPLDRLRNDPNKPTAVADDNPVESLSRHSERSSKLAKFAHILEAQDEEQLSETRKMLIRAGYRDRDAARTLVAAQILLGIGLLVVGLLYVMLLGGNMSLHKIILSVILPGMVGYYGPKYWLKNRVESRQEAILQALPDALDLMLICIEAGQSLDQAIIRVSSEIVEGFPDLGEELEIVAQEIKAGKDKASVLRAFADRCDLPDIRSFVTVLIQSQSFGTSIAEALRVYAAEMRDKRVMRAEEKANVIPTKMTMGTMAFCVPPLLIILVGPALIGIAQTLGGGF